MSLVGGAVDPEELSHGLAQTTPPKFQAYEPGSGPEDDEDESEMTAEQIGKTLYILNQLPTKLQKIPG